MEKNFTEKELIERYETMSPEEILNEFHFIENMDGGKTNLQALSRMAILVRTAKLKKIELPSSKEFFELQHDEFKPAIAYSGPEKWDIENIIAVFFGILLIIGGGMLSANGLNLAVFAIVAGTVLIYKAQPRSN